VRNREHYEILDGGFDVEQAAIFFSPVGKGASDQTQGAMSNNHESRTYVSLRIDIALLTECGALS